MTLANRLTLLRLALVPAFMVFMIVDHLWTRLAALVIFFGASLLGSAAQPLAAMRAALLHLPATTSLLGLGRDLCRIQHLSIAAAWMCTVLCALQRR